MSAEYTRHFLSQKFNPIHPPKSLYLCTKGLKPNKYKHIIWIGRFHKIAVDNSLIATYKGEEERGDALPHNSTNLRIESDIHYIQVNNTMNQTPYSYPFLHSLIKPMWVPLTLPPKCPAAPFPPGYTQNVMLSSPSPTRFQPYFHPTCSLKQPLEKTQ